MPRVYIGIGSNLEPERHLPQAARGLRARFHDVHFSACYRNPAAGGGPDYVNAAATFNTDLAVDALSRLLREFEAQCGRRRDAAGCALDLDLLWYEGLVGATAAGPLPRPELLHRGYQLGPLAELAPQLRHPLADATLAQLWQSLRPLQPPLLRTSLELNQEAAGAQ